MERGVDGDLKADVLVRSRPGNRQRSTGRCRTGEHPKQPVDRRVRECLRNPLARACCPALAANRDVGSCSMLAVVITKIPPSPGAPNAIIADLAHAATRRQREDMV